MHLTNYSVNKFNKAAFVQNNDPGRENHGSKWSLTGLRKSLRAKGIDDFYLFKRIEDIVIKTIISGETILNNAFEMFVPHRNNCFELLGFDILIDDTLNPWLLEVNMSPSLACDSTLDQNIKAGLLADLMNLTGVVSNEFRTKQTSKGVGGQVYKNQPTKVSSDYLPSLVGPMKKGKAKKKKTDKSLI